MIKKILSLLFLSLFIIGIWAANYEIESYDIEIKADKDGWLNITETLNVRFLEKSHGIYRDIQYTFDNPNGNSFDPVKAEIENISATSLNKTEKEDGVLRLTLGNPKEYAKDNETYKIQYRYRLDYNRTEGYDELYYNIVSPAWDTSIKNITWSVSLPSPIERDRIWVTEGKEGGTRSGGFDLGRNNTYLEGEKELLLPYSAITLRLEMDKGYWKGWDAQKDNSTPFVISGLVIAFIFTLSAMIFWTLFGKDKPIDTSGIRNTPPEGINPMEAGFIIDQSTSVEKEGFAMIFKWAEEGRLTIRETETTKKGEKPSFSFTKLKDLDFSAKESEKALFDSIFFKDEVTMEDMVNHGFANDFISKVVKNLTKENKSHKERKSVILQGVFLSLGLICAVASAILFSQRHMGALSLLMVLCFVIPSFLTALVFSLYSESGKIWNKNSKIIVLVLTFLVLLLGLLFSILLVNEAQLSFFTLTCVIISYFMFIVGMAVSGLMDKKSDEGNEKLKACVEYRNYLSSLLEGKIKPTEEDKKIWGTHMAYALALGLKTKGENLDLDMPQPTWFYGPGWNNGWFTYYILFHSCSSSYSTAVFHSTGSTTPGGGGFSSSGFSGGGFSGGGGGSW